MVLTSPIQARKMNKWQSTVLELQIELEFQFSFAVSSRVIAAGNRGVTLHWNEMGRLSKHNSTFERGFLRKSKKRGGETYTAIPSSTQSTTSSGTGFPSVPIAHSIFIDHNITAVSINRESVATCRPIHERRPNPKATWPSSLVSGGAGTICLFRSKKRVGLKWCVSEP